jgi:hypothetical protein
MRKPILRWSRKFERTCLDCGFFTRGGAEVTQDEQILLHCRGTVGWVGDAGSFDCAKGLWFTLGDHDPDAILLHQIELTRSVAGFRRCPGFRPHVPGRTPADHLRLEDESRQFRNQRMIAALAFVGGLLGALIGALLKGWLGK